MPAYPLFDVITPGLTFLALSLGGVALCLVTILVALVEGVVLTLFKWNNFPRSLLGSGIANLVSGLAAGALLIFLQKLPVIWMGIAFLLSILIEGAILLKIQPESGRRTWLVALVANIASYAILILPAYLFSLGD